MSNLVRLSRDKENDIAIITIDNPPVNALSPGVPEGIASAINTSPIGIFIERISGELPSAIAWAKSIPFAGSESKNSRPIVF